MGSPDHYAAGCTGDPAPAGPRRWHEVMPRSQKREHELTDPAGREHVSEVSLGATDPGCLHPCGKIARIADASATSFRSVAVPWTLM